MKTKINDLKKEVLDAFNEEFGTDFKRFDELPTLIGSDLGEVDNEAEIQQKLDTFKCLWESKLELIEAKRENEILKNKLQILEKALNDILKWNDDGDVDGDWEYPETIASRALEKLNIK